MRFPRSSGILLHPISLPGGFGIGDLGDEAYTFADFLVASGQSVWQMLPVGPTGYGDSPYASYSAFAGNTLLVSPERLVTVGLLRADDLTEAPALSNQRIDYNQVYESKDKFLHTAFVRYTAAPVAEMRDAYERFCLNNAQWLEDYTLFRALKNIHGGKPWHQWDEPFARRDAMALAHARATLGKEIEAQKFYQFLFFTQWFELKAYCNERGIRIVGDIPIFVAHDSADVWTNPDQFKLNQDGTPTVVAGVPPDYYSATGQLWGNPLYNWEGMVADNFQWWIERVRATLRAFDIARIDHFRGLVAGWEIPFGHTTAEQGRWVTAPGKELFTALRESLGELPIIAEDLGVITSDVEELREKFGFPGMRVLQFGFRGDLNNLHLSHNYPANVVAYTSTHDSDTTLGWFRQLATESSDANPTAAEREFCLRYLHPEGKELNWEFIDSVLASAADTAIVPLQDVLGLGTEGRMNVPSTAMGNWSWRYDRNALNEILAERLHRLVKRYSRIRLLG